MALNTNHSTTTRLEIAVSRWRLQWPTPARAAPSPRTLAIGDRVLITVVSAGGREHEPDQDGRRAGETEHSQPGAIGDGRVEAVAGVPDQMTDAVAQVEEQDEGVDEQDQQAEPGVHRRLQGGEGIGS